MTAGEKDNFPTRPQMSAHHKEQIEEQSAPT
jgi:hypothetical protein